MERCFFEDLPREVLSSIILEHQLIVVFQLNKYFSTFANEDFWKGFSSVVSNKQFPPTHYSLDQRISCEVILPASWREYAIARFKYNLKYTKGPVLARRRLMVIRKIIHFFKDLKKELSNMERSPPPGIYAKPIDESNLAHWRGTIIGPVIFFPRFSYNKRRILLTAVVFFI